MEKKLSAELGQIASRFAQARPLKVMFQDEARFGRISDSVYCWAKRPQRPMVQAMLTHQYVYAYAAVCPTDGAWTVTPPKCGKTSAEIRFLWRHCSP